MRCKSHFFIFKSDKCMKGSYDFMKNTGICYFCMRYLKKNYGITESDLLEKNFYKNFLKSGSLSPKYLPLSIGISE
jgi:hypothetical protein